MGSFEDQLWTELAQAHGDELADTTRSSARRGRGRPLALTAGAFGVVGAVTAAALALTATTSAPAYAVTRNTDGTVTITIRQLAGVTGANAELARLGVPVRAVTIDPSCHDESVPDTTAPNDTNTRMFAESMAAHEVTVRLAGIPAGDTLVLAGWDSDSMWGMLSGLVRGPAPSCIPGDPHPRIYRVPTGR